MNLREGLFVLGCRAIDALEGKKDATASCVRHNTELIQSVPAIINQGKLGIDVGASEGRLAQIGRSG